MAQALPISPGPWLGTDGNWSTFQIYVGTPPKLVFVLPATSQSTIWTVMSLSCSYEATGGAISPDDCANARGQLFDPGNSTSFDYDGFKAMYDQGNYFGLPFESEAAISTSIPEYTGSAIVGSDIISFSSNGPPLSNQTLACFVNSGNAYPFLGQLGLQSQNATIKNFTDNHQSILGYLNSTGDVPSASFGYTAGSKGQNMQGSLTFGGYDADRLVPDQIINERISSSSDGRDLQIVVADIQVGSTQISGLPANAAFLIDSMVPDIWLPADVCDQIASAYGLTYNSTYEIYTNGTQGGNDLSSPLIFTLQALGDASATTKITIPYIDLAHQLQYPEASITNGSVSIPYFPIRRANTSDQYYLGRTFLQDA